MGHFIQKKVTLKKKKKKDGEHKDGGLNLSTMRRIYQAHHIVIMIIN